MPTPLFCVELLVKMNVWFPSQSVLASDVLSCLVIENGIDPLCLAGGANDAYRMATTSVLSCEAAIYITTNFISTLTGRYHLAIAPPAHCVSLHIQQLFINLGCLKTNCVHCTLL